MAVVLLGIASLLPRRSLAADDEQGRSGRIVAQAIRPVMDQYGIPGMAVGIVMKEHRYVYNYGTASKATATPVSDTTLFEVGSVSKTFTATLAALAQVTGHLALADPASHYLPGLRGGSFDGVSLLNLGTHTSGGFPLQLPAAVTTDGQLMAYFQRWKPTYAPGTRRIYSNPGIGMLGLIAARSMNDGFAALMEGKVFPGLGLQHTFLVVPKDQGKNYAQGYTASDLPIRLAPGELAAETYGIRTTAGDLLRFLAANMGLLPLERNLQQALKDTHTGYYRLGAMTQDLIWEQYRYPVRLADLLSGNSAPVVYDPQAVTVLAPPLPPQEDVLINKTGSTNGFSAYVAFIPEKKVGVVVLADKSYPIAARVTAGYEILAGLNAEAPPP